MNVDTTQFDGVVPSEGASLQYIYQKFNREDFRTPSKDPITITRVALLAINYIYALAPETFNTNVPNSALDAAQLSLNRVRYRISVPGRQHYSRFELSVPSYGPLPTWGEPVPNPPSARANTFGRVRLNYERPFYMPRTGAFDIQLSSPSDVTYDGPPNIPNVFGSQGVTSVPAEVLFLEKGGLNPASARSKRFPLNFSQNPNQVPGQNGYPYPLPPNFSPATVNNGVPFWDRRHLFSAGEFRKQEATRAGSNLELGVSVAIDQYAYDSALINTFGATGKIAPLSARVGSRVRTVDFGSQSDWWRPGAPIALTFDSVTPALVVPLPQPITLQPGDTFEVEAQVPGPDYTLGFLGEQNTEKQNAVSYQLGISFNGYTTVKG